MTTEQLLQKAISAEQAHRNYTNTEKWIPVVDVFRRKGWSWVSIYEWLKKEGEHVQKTSDIFTSVMSRRYKGWLSKQAEKAQEKTHAAASR